MNQSFFQRAYYLAGHQASGLKVGDKVRILRKAETHEGGWCNDWIDTHMNQMIGKIVEIYSDCNSSGFDIMCKVDLHGDGEVKEYSFRFPYFVLEKVEEPKETEEALKGAVEIQRPEGFSVTVRRGNPNEVNEAIDWECSRLASETHKYALRRETKRSILRDLQRVLRRVKETKKKFDDFDESDFVYVDSSIRAMECAIEHWENHLLMMQNLRGFVSVEKARKTTSGENSQEKAENSEKGIDNS